MQHASIDGSGDAKMLAAPDQLLEKLIDPEGQRGIEGYTGLPGVYCIVISKITRTEWHAVVEALVQKHAQRQPVVVEYGNLMDCLSALRFFNPTYTCFVVQPKECSRRFVRCVHYITRNINQQHCFSVTASLFTVQLIFCNISSP